MEVSLTERISLRDKFFDAFARTMIPVYQVLRRSKKPWSVTQAELATYPAGSLGKAVSEFLESNQLTLIPRAEFHDVYHVLFDFTTSMKDETAIQFLGVGNGRYSLPWLASCALAFAFYPERWGKFYRAFMQGRNAQTVHGLNWEELLDVSLVELKDRLGVK